MTNIYYRSGHLDRNDDEGPKHKRPLSSLAIKLNVGKFKKVVSLSLYKFCLLAQIFCI